MRLHSLEITAFGPFAGTVAVDFDDLAQAGLFLLAGPTGAGKTSILDAVCFGLYGEVPGDRAAAKHLRSDHAAAGVEPRVVLDLSIAGRTFRFTRSPGWWRPKKRGDGTVRVQPHVVVEERTDTGWISLTNRLDDAGLLVADLLGMTCAQFTQVAMLPQGRFQAFLRATSAERHAVLSKLFRTGRFEDVERWLVEHRGELRRRSQAAQERAVGVVSRLQEAAGTTVPEDWDLSDLAPAADRGEVSGWAGRLAEVAVAASTDAAADLESATLAAATADAAREHGARAQTAQRRAATARADLDDIAAHASELEATRRALDAHRRAHPIAGLVARATRTAAAATQSTRMLSTRLDDAAALLGADPAMLDDARLGEAQRTAAESRAVAAAFAPREAELDTARGRVSALATQVLGLEVLVDRDATEVARLPGEISRVQESLQAARLGARLLGPAEQSLTSSRCALVAARRAAELRLELARARTVLQAHADRAQALRDEYQNVRELRIHGMAAELAGRLASGCGCPVCGSARHPSPAVASGGAVGKDEEDAARRAYEQAGFERQTQQELVLTLDGELTRATADSAGVDAAQLAADVTTRLAAVAVAHRAEADAVALEDELHRLQESLARTTGSLAEARADLAVARAAGAEASDLAGRLGAELSELLAHGEQAQTVAELVDEHAERTRVFAVARDALRSHELAARAAVEAQEIAHASAEAAGFADVAAALAAVLEDASSAAASEVLAAAVARSAAARATLADPEVADLLTADVPDLDGLESALKLAVRERERAGATHGRAREREARLTELGAELETELAAWAPIRSQYAVSAALSAFVEGKGPDNPQRVRLSAYVLSERLRQVVDAANERLAQMSDQRYSLEHTDDRGAGEVRGGLSLLVRDDWNGTRRDPATLSGGETFVVSLALALGLADTVSHEAGGTDIDTLFIDEGFGSLDSDTLEDVMDTLDSLRDGGRVVGIVSHVAELRTRITSQLEVTKTRTGSTIRTARVAG